MANNAVETIIRLMAQKDSSIDSVTTEVQQKFEKLFNKLQGLMSSLSSVPSASLTNIQTAILDMDKALGKATEDTKALASVIGKMSSESITSMNTALSQYVHNLDAIVGRMQSLSALPASPSDHSVVINQRPRDDYKQDATDAILAADAIATTINLLVRAMNESVTHGTEILKNLDTVRDRIRDITHDISRTQSIIQSTNLKSLESEFGLNAMRKASAQLEMFHQDAIKNLKPVADLAAYAGKDITDTANVFGRVMEGQKRAFGLLKSQYDINPADLARFGAELDRTGNVAVKTAAQIERASKALAAWIQAYAEGASQPDTLEGKLTSAENAMQMLQEELAKPMLPIIQSVTGSIKDLSSWLVKLPDELKSTFAGLMTFGNGMGLAAAATLAFAAPVNNAIALLARLKAASDEAKIAGAASNTWTLGSTTSTVAAANNTGLLAKAAATLGMEVGTLSGAFLALGPVILAAVAVLGTAWYEIEKYQQQQITLGEEIAKESKRVTEANREWKDHIALLNEAGKSQGIVVKTSSDTAQELKNVSDAIQSIDVEKLNAIFIGRGWNAENFKKVANKAKSEATAAEQQLELLEKVGHAVETTQNKVKDKEGNEYGTESKHINLNKLTPEEQTQYKAMVKNPGSVSELVETRKQKQEEYNKLQERSIVLNDTYKKSFSEPERMLAGMKEREEATKNLFILASRAKGTENLTEKLKVLNEQAKINKKEFKTMELNIPNNILDLLKYLEKLTPSQATLRGIAEDQLKLLVEAKETETKIDKEVTSSRIKEIERERNAAQQAEQDGLQTHKMTAEQKLSADKQYLAYFDKISSGSLLNQQKLAESYIEINDRKYDLTPKKVEKFSGVGPKSEDQQLLEDQERYSKDATFRKYVDDKRLSDKKKITSEEKSIESDNLKDLEVQFENYLSSKREITKNDIGAQINDLNYISSEYQKAANNRLITDEAAAKKRADILKQTSELAIKLKQAEIDKAAKSTQVDISSSDTVLKRYEKELAAGKDVQAQILKEVEKRLQKELDLIEIRAKKEIEASDRSQQAISTIEKEAQIARIQAMTKEKEYLDGILQKQKEHIQSTKSALSTNTNPVQFPTVNAFGKDKQGKDSPGVEAIPSFSGYGNDDNEPGTKEPVGEMAKPVDPIRSGGGSSAIQKESEKYENELDKAGKALSAGVSNASSSLKMFIDAVDLATQGLRNTAGNMSGTSAGTSTSGASGAASSAGKVSQKDINQQSSLSAYSPMAALGGQSPMEAAGYSVAGFVAPSSPVANQSSIIEQVQNNNKQSNVSNTYMFGKDAITPPADMLASLDGLYQRMEDMRKTGPFSY
jgi:hypothetical protein